LEAQPPPPSEAEEAAKLVEAQALRVKTAWEVNMKAYLELDLEFDVLKTAWEVNI